MTFDKFTIKAQEAVQEAVNLVQARGQQAIEPEHLLAGVLKVGENVTNFLFQKLGVNSRQIEQVLQSQIASLPRVQGGEPYLSRESNEVLTRAQDYATKAGDEFVSLEPIIQALLTVNSTASKCSGSMACWPRACTRLTASWTASCALMVNLSNVMVVLLSMFNGFLFLVSLTAFGADNQETSKNLPNVGN